MNQRILPTCVFLLLFTASMLSVHAQDAEEPIAPDDSFTPQFRVGISGGLTKSFHQDMVINLPVGPSNLTTDSVIQSGGTSVGLVVGYKPTKRVGCAVHLLYSTHLGSGLHVLPKAKILIPSPDPNKEPTIIEQIIQIRREVEYSLLGLDLMGTFDVLSTDVVGAGIAAGISVAHVEKFTENLTQELVSPPDARFNNSQGWPTKNQGRILVFAEDEPVENGSSTRVAVRAGGYIDLGFFGPVHIVPGVYYDYGLTSVLKDSDWTLNTLLFQLDVMMEL